MRYTPWLSANGQAYIKTLADDNYGSIYIACLSEKADDLRQWLPYSANATGAAIQFSPMQNNLHYITNDPGVSIIKVSYASVASKEAYLEGFLDKALDTVTFGSTLISAFLVKMTEGMLGDLIACKSDHYKDEAEWRLYTIQWLSNLKANPLLPKPEYHVKNGIIKPFLTIDVRMGAIKEVVLGPLCEKPLNTDSFQWLSYHKVGYAPMIRYSAIQYRG